MQTIQFCPFVFLMRINEMYRLCCQNCCQNVVLVCEMMAVMGERDDCNLRKFCHLTNTVKIDAYKLEFVCCWID